MEETRQAFSHPLQCVRFLIERAPGVDLHGLREPAPRFVVRGCQMARYPLTTRAGRCRGACRGRFHALFVEGYADHGGIGAQAGSSWSQAAAAV